MGCKGVQHFTRRELLANMDRSIDWHMCGSCCVVPKAAYLLEESWHGLEKRCVAHSLAAALCLETQAFRREDIGNWNQNTVPKNRPERGSQHRRQHGSNDCGWTHKPVEKADRLSALTKGPKINNWGHHTNRSQQQRLRIFLIPVWQMCMEMR